MKPQASAGLDAASTAPSSPLMTTLKLLYCASQVALPVIASFYLGHEHRTPGLHPTLFALAAFLACCIVLILQILFYLTLPDSTPAMLMMVLGPPIWLVVQYLRHPFDLNYYLVSAGVSSMLSIAIGFAYWIVVRNYLLHPGIAFRALKHNVPRGSGILATIMTVALLVLLQVVFLVTPVLIVIIHFTSYLVREHLMGSGVTWVDVFLTLMFVAHNAVQSLLVLQREDIVSESG